MTNATNLEDTGERMIPEFHKGTLIYGEHLTRYLSTKNITKGKTVLDIACGSGYGSQLIAKEADKVIGVDISKESIEYAKQHFSSPNLEYMVGSGEKIPLADNSMDVVVSFETIEHVKDYLKFIKEIKRVLKNDGVAIISTPNDLEFAEGNHFHLHQFKYKELLGIVKKYFSFVDSYYQGTWKYVGLGNSAFFEKGDISNISTLNLAPLKPDQYIYFYLICSNKKINFKIDSLGALSSHYSDRQEHKERLVHEETVNLVNTLRTDNSRLTNKLEDQIKHSQNLEVELGQIKESKAYKLALKFRSIKNYRMLEDSDE